MKNFLFLCVVIIIFSFFLLFNTTSEFPSYCDVTDQNLIQSLSKLFRPKFETCMQSDFSWKKDHHLALAITFLISLICLCIFSSLNISAQLRSKSGFTLIVQAKFVDVMLICCINRISAWKKSIRRAVRFWNEANGGYF